MVHAFIADSWRDYVAIAEVESVAPPYVYVVDSLFAKPFSITLGTKEFIVVDMRAFFHLALLSRATVGTFSTGILTFSFGRLYSEKLYLAGRFSESAAHLLVSDGYLQGRFFQTDEWLNKSTAWQFRFLLAHELCHTMMRLSPNFRENALRVTHDILGRITIDDWRHEKQRESEVSDWLDEQIPLLSTNTGISEEQFAWTQSEMAKGEDASFDKGDIASLREDDSGLKR